MNLLDNIHEINNKLNNKLNLQDLQVNFLKSDIGQIANSVVDISLKALLPDNIENEVINVKNAFIDKGFQAGIESVVENAIQVGKKFLGIENENFESINQVQDTLANGKLIENISNNLDTTLKNISNSNNIENETINKLENNKNNIINNVEKNINNEFSNQIKSVEKIEKYIENWKKSYQDKNIEELNKQFNKIEKEMKKIMPLENIIKNVQKIESINELIKNSKEFNFSNIYLDLIDNLK